MSKSLIINARHHLRWHQRFFSDASTAMLWGGWLWMWRPLNSLGASSHHFMMKLLANGSPVSIEGSMMALVGTSGTLLLWNLLPAQKVSASPQANTLHDYATHFELPEQDIIAGRSTSVCVVHHDEAGCIIRIEAKT